MTATCATVIGIVLQVLGAGYLVVQAWCTSRKLAKYNAQRVTINSLGPTIEALARELGGQFGQQLVGFGFVLVGSGLQLYAAVIA